MQLEMQENNAIRKLKKSQEIKSGGHQKNRMKDVRLLGKQESVTRIVQEEISPEYECLPKSPDCMCQRSA